MFRALALTVLCLGFSGIAAMAAPYQAGVPRLAAKEDGGETSSSIIWYPTDAAEVPWQAGPFRIAASQDASVAPGQFPVVLLSHGRQGGFVFVDPCPEAVAAESALVCLDEPGVDRPAVHRRLKSEVTEFLKGNL
ncbi:hypothetical protein [Comamonas odontotermitis]|uniref:hypothetical protein n=1 Tax=Comamonas odontotermitis TaxID=379895 RepID=UPI003753DFF4